MMNDKPFAEVGKRIIKISSIVSIELADEREYDFTQGEDVNYQVIKIHFEPETPHLYIKSTEIDYAEALALYNYIQSNMVMTLPVVDDSSISTVHALLRGRLFNYDIEFVASSYKETEDGAELDIHAPHIERLANVGIEYIVLDDIPFGNLHRVKVTAVRDIDLEKDSSREPSFQDTAPDAWGFGESPE